MARAAQLRGVVPMQLSSPSSNGGDGVAARPDDDVVLLLERAKDSKSAPLRSEYLQKYVLGPHAMLQAWFKPCQQ